MKTTAQKPVPAEGQCTPEHLRAALGNAALEGQRVRKGDLADLREFVAGRLSDADCLARIKARYVVSA